MKSSDCDDFNELPFFVAGIGASAGGLQPLLELFKHIPKEPNMAFIVVQHLHPTSASHMDTLLAKCTKLPCLIAKNKTKIEANKIYLLPPGKIMIVSNGLLILSQRDSESAYRHPIDILFKTLAEDFRHFSVGIILSGSGSDGAQGVVKINECGGINIVQSFETCEFDSMPKMAFETKAVDYRLNPKEIPEILSRVSSRIKKIQSHIINIPMGAQDTSISEILILIKSRLGLDFFRYKSETIIRRLERRLIKHSIKDIRNYVKMLLENSDELKKLSSYLLIGTTSFFRDKDYFEFIEKSLPKFLEDFVLDKEIRIWVVGCSRGEEAYTLAMLFQEYLEANNIDKAFKIFATDLQKTSIKYASNGIYSKKEVEQIPKAYRKKYLFEHGDQFRIDPTLRKKIIFAQHNVFVDPPFNKVHIISCRNLLIYFTSETKKKVIETLSFSLRYKGMIILGSSESIQNEFSPYLKKLSLNKNIFQKVEEFDRVPSLEFSTAVSVIKPRTHIDRNTYNDSKRIDRGKERLLQEFVPPSLIIDDFGKVYHIYNNGNEYLTLRPGEVNSHISAYVQKPASFIIQNMVKFVSEKKITCKSSSVGGFKDGKILDVHVMGLSEEVEDKKFYLVIFHELAKSKKQKFIKNEVGLLNINKSEFVDFDELVKELIYTKETLNTAVEKLETSNEELQSSNEELIASNEELQSTNEELQSVNEQLNIVNTQLFEKENERLMLEGDEKKILEISQLIVLLLDAQFRIRKFSSNAAKLFNLLTGDEGRPFSAVIQPFRINMMKWCQQSLQEGASFEREIEDNNGNWYLCRIDRINHEQQDSKSILKYAGVVISLVEITAMKLAQQRYQESESRSQNILDSISDGFFEWNPQSDFVYVHQDFKDYLGYDHEHISIKNLFKDDYVSLENQFPKVRSEIKRFTIPIEVYNAQGEKRWMQCKCKIENMVLIGFLTDISELKKKEDNLESSAKHLENTNRLLEEFVHIVSHDLKAPLRHISNHVNFLKEALIEKEIATAFGIINKIDTSTSRLEKLVNDIVVLSKVSQDYSRIKFEQVSLNDLIGEVFVNMRDNFKIRKDQLEVENLPKIQGNKTLLMHLFQNIISNGFIYNNKSNKKVFIKFKSEQDFDTVIVEDNGMGFSQEFAEIIFKPFKRLYTKDQIEGSGIGLAICKTIAELHTSKIWAISEINRGTKFYIKFPKERLI